MKIHKSKFPQIRNLHLIGFLLLVVDNGPAYKAGYSRRLQQSSEEIGDPFEISTLKKEDIIAHKGVAEGDDVIQGQSKPSTQSMRGHQGKIMILVVNSGWHLVAIN